MLGPTPIEALRRASDYFGGPELYIKRDDFSILAGGGNKTRKLEYLVADALDQGADTLVTCGAHQSNHARLTLAAARKEGLRCHLILSDPTGHSRGTLDASGNLFLDRLMGAERILLKPKDVDLFKALEEETARCIAEGHKPYPIPLGGSNALGALGYAECGMEIADYEAKTGAVFDYVVAPAGSGGTLAGLIAGLREAGSQARVLGMNVLMGKAAQEALIFRLICELQETYHLGRSVQEMDVECYVEGLGPGYALPTSGMKEAVRVLAEKEGILLDPTYTGKAFAGLAELIRGGMFRPQDRVLFVHTGGSPALFEHQDWFMNPESPLE
jgi:D-cysteine desulfhydrase